MNLRRELPISAHFNLRLLSFQGWKPRRTNFKRLFSENILVLTPAPVLHNSVTALLGAPPSSPRDEKTGFVVLTKRVCEYWKRLRERGIPGVSSPSRFRPR